MIFSTYCTGLIGHRYYQHNKYSRLPCLRDAFHKVTNILRPSKNMQSDPTCAKICAKRVTSTSVSVSLLRGVLNGIVWRLIRGSLRQIREAFFALYSAILLSLQN